VRSASSFRDHYIIYTTIENRNISILRILFEVQKHREEPYEMKKKKLTFFLSVLPFFSYFTPFIQWNAFFKQAGHIVYRLKILNTKPKVRNFFLPFFYSAAYVTHVYFALIISNTCNLTILESSLYNFPFVIFIIEHVSKNVVCFKILKMINLKSLAYILSIFEERCVCVCVCVCVCCY